MFNRQILDFNVLNYYITSYTNKMCFRIKIEFCHKILILRNIVIDKASFCNNT